MEIRKLIIGLIMLGLSAVSGISSSYAVETGVATLTPNFAASEGQEGDISGAVKLLSRFRVDNEYGRASSEFDAKLFQAYREGRVSEDEFNQFYPTGSKELKQLERDVTWKKVSFSFYEDKDSNTKMRLEVKPKDRAVMLRVTFKAPKPR